VVREAAWRRWAFEFGEGLFDRIEIGTVRRQVADLGSGRGNQLADSRHLVGGKVAEDDDVAGAQFRVKNVLRVGGKDGGIDRSLHEKGGGDALS